MCVDRSGSAVRTPSSLRVAINQKILENAVAGDAEFSANFIFGIDISKVRSYL